MLTIYWVSHEILLTERDGYDNGIVVRFFKMPYLLETTTDLCAEEIARREETKRQIS